MCVCVLNPKTESLAFSTPPLPPPLFVSSYMVIFSVSICSHHLSHWEGTGSQIISPFLTGPTHSRRKKSQQFIHMAGQYCKFRRQIICGPANMSAVVSELFLDDEAFCCRSNWNQTKNSLYLLCKVAIGV